MNKKLFKRLLITASLLSPIALVTPIILTSCSNSEVKPPSDGDQNPGGPDNGSGGGSNGGGSGGSGGGSNGGGSGGSGGGSNGGGSGGGSNGGGSGGSGGGSNGGGSGGSGGGSNGGGSGGSGEGGDNTETPSPEQKEVDFIKELDNFEKNGGNYEFKGKLKPFNENFKDTETLKKWLTGSNKNSEKETENNELDFSDNLFTDFIFNVRNQLENVTGSSDSSRFLFKNNKILDKKNIKTHSVNSNNVTAKVTVSPKEDQEEESLFLSKAGDSKAVGSVKIEFELKSGYKWKSYKTTDKFDGDLNTNPKIILEFTMDTNENILNPLDEFLQVSGKSADKKEYLLVATDNSKENRLLKELSDKLGNLEKFAESTDKNKDVLDSDTPVTTDASLNEKRVDVLASIFKDVTFEEKTSAFAKDNNEVVKKSDKVSETVKESLKELFTDLNLFNIVHSEDEDNKLENVHYGSSLFAPFLNLDYLFKNSDLYLEVKSSKKDVEITPTKAGTQAEKYNVGSYSYDLQIVFKLKDDKNKWNGLKEKAPIRVLFKDLYDVKTSIGLDKIIDAELSKNTKVDTPWNPNSFDFVTKINDSKDILSEKATTEQAALNELYTKISSAQLKASITPPTLDLSKKTVNLDDSKFAADKLIKYLLEQMDVDFSFGQNKKPFSISGTPSTPNKDAVFTDWFFSDRFNTNLKVSMKKAVLDPQPTEKQEFTFEFEFKPKTNFNWTIQDLKHSQKPIKLVFAINNKASTPVIPFVKN